MRWPAVDVMVQQRRLEVVVLWRLFEEFLKLRSGVGWLIGRVLRKYDLRGWKLLEDVWES
jgi:hypothetical protein